MIDPAKPVSELERVELAIVEHLKGRLPNDVRIDVQPDDAENWDMAGANRAVLVHFGASRPSATNRSAVSGPVSYAIIVLARSLRGAAGGYNLIEACEQAIANTALPGCRAFTVVQSALQEQSGGLWRWVIEVETELQRGAIIAAPATFIESFGEKQ